MPIKKKLYEEMIYQILLRLIYFKKFKINLYTIYIKPLLKYDPLE